jgi:hypothetical protein
VATFAADAAQVDGIYPRPSVELSYRQNLSFVDLTHPGQVFPGFDVSTPTLRE